MIQDLFPPSTRVNRIVPKRTFIDKLEAIISGREERYQVTAIAKMHLLYAVLRDTSMANDSVATNFEQLMDKVAHALQVERGLARNEHFREIEEMAQLGNGTARRVTSMLLSRAACMGIACNADQRKPMVKMAREYFQGALTGKELAKGMEGNVLIYRSSTGKVNVSVLFNQETFWLSQQRMAELFGTAVSTINYHLKQIDECGEVHLSDTIRKIRIPSEQWDEQGVTLKRPD